MSTNIDSLLTSQSGSVQSAQAAFMQKVYAWMMGGLLVTTAIAYAATTIESVAILAQSSFILLLFAELGLVWYLSSAIERMKVDTARIMFLVYSALNGLTLSVVFALYTTESIVNVFFITSAMFGAMSAYGYVTKRDLTSVGSFFFMGLIGIIIASVVNIFMQSSVLSFAISFIGVFVFVGLTAYDTQKIKEAYAIEMQDAELGAKVAVIAALSLYLDFINLFLMLLRLLGRRR